MGRSEKGIENARKAVRDYQKRRKEAGERKVTVWMTPDVRLSLERLKAIHGSNDAAIAAALTALAKGI